MLDRLFGPRIRLSVSILGVVGNRMIQWRGQVRLRKGATVRDGLRAAGRSAGVDLLGALGEGVEPSILLDGTRLALPEELSRCVDDEMTLTWLMPMAGG